MSLTTAQCPRPSRPRPSLSPPCVHQCHSTFPHSPPLTACASFFFSSPTRCDDSFIRPAPRREEARRGPRGQAQGAPYVAFCIIPSPEQAHSSRRPSNYLESRLLPVRRPPAEDGPTSAFSSAAWGVGDGNDGGTGGARRFGRTSHRAQSAARRRVTPSPALITFPATLVSRHQANRGRAAAEVKRSRQAQRAPSKPMAEPPGLLNTGQPSRHASASLKLVFRATAVHNLPRGKEMKLVALAVLEVAASFSCVLAMLSHPGAASL